jgi:hypothetical protein
VTDLTAIDPEVHYNYRVRAGELSDHNLAQLRETLLDLTTRIPKLGSSLGGDIDLILDASAAERKPILSQIVEYVAHIEDSLVPLKVHARTYVDENCGPYIDAFNAHRGNKILFISGRPYFQILREALALRDKGYMTAIIYLAPVNDDIASMISESFDLALQLPKNLLMLGHMLSDINTDLIHVQCWMHNYYLPISRFVLENKEDAKVICEFYDILTVYSDKAAMEQYTPEFADYTFEIDRFVWTHGDAFLVRAPEEVHADLRARYKFTSPIIEMHPFPSRRFARYRADENYKPNDRPRIVLAGSLMPRNPDGSINWPRYSAGVGTLAAIESILAQGMEVTVFHDPHKPLNDPEFSPYFEIKNTRGNLHLLDGVPPNKLSEILKDFDFGISLAALDRDALDVRPLHFKTAVGTKLFGYLEAGLPIIVNKENEYIAHIVESNGLGFAVHTSEFGEIADRIAAFDYPECIRNIKKYNEAHSMDREINRVTNLYASLNTKA